MKLYFVGVVTVVAVFIVAGVATGVVAMDAAPAPTPVPLTVEDIEAHLKREVARWTQARDAMEAQLELLKQNEDQHIEKYKRHELAFRDAADGLEGQMELLKKQDDEHIEKYKRHELQFRDAVDGLEGQMELLKNRVSDEAIMKLVTRSIQLQIKKACLGSTPSPLVSSSSSSSSSQSGMSADAVTTTAVEPCPVGMDNGNDDGTKVPSHSSSSSSSSSFSSSWPTWKWIVVIASSVLGLFLVIALAVMTGYKLARSYDASYESKKQTLLFDGGDNIVGGF